MSNANPSPTNGDTTENCTDATTRLLPQHVHLGTDREGYRHHLDRDADVVYRLDDATIERRTALDGRPLDHYLAFVAAEVGWRTRHQIATWDVFPEVW